MVIIVQILREEGAKALHVPIGMARPNMDIVWGGRFGWGWGGVPDANLLTQIVSIYDTVTLSQQLKSTRPQNHRVLSLAGPCM